MTNPETLAEILDEYLRALEAGFPPDKEALLAKHPSLREELEAAFVGIDFVHGAAPRFAPEMHGDAVPEGLLGDYRLLRELGRGGMAVVYEAEQMSLARHVALKVLPFAAVLDPKQLQRFKNEAMAAAHLRHPNIVPVYGIGCERGVHYYAMQYVEGQDLATAIRDMRRGRRETANGPRTPISSHGSNHEPAYIRMAAALGVQAAGALDHAHQLGIVHRDVKPGNLLADLAGSLWVTDFGLASSMRDVSLTITGELLGTLRYMSPEQALAKRVPVDHRTDIYSLGATLYELLTLEPAFPGDDAHRVMQDIALKEPVLPRRLNSALPHDLETVLLKAMSKDPAGRYATAQEMADDLTRFLENRPIEAKRPGLLRRVSKWSRRHRTLVAATVVLLLLSTAGLATGTALLLREQAQTKKAFDSSQANLDLALQALDQIYIDEAESEPKIRAGLSRDLLQKGLGFYEEFAKENARNKGLDFLMGNACQRAGLIFRELGEEERAVETLDRAVNAYDRAIALDPRAAEIHYNRGDTMTHLRRYADALAAYDQVLEIDPRYVNALNRRGSLLCDHLGRPAEALAAFDQALELEPQNATALTDRGTALSHLERLEDALAAYDYAIAIHPRDARAYNGRSNTLLELKRMEDALAAADKAIDLDPWSAWAYRHRGDALRDLGCVEDALAAYERAVEIDPRDEGFQCQRGNMLSALRRFAEALEAYDKALAIDPGSAPLHHNRANALLALGQFDEALAAVDRAAAIDPLNGVIQYGRGSILAAMGDVDGAIAASRKAVLLKPDFYLAHCGLANMLAAKGELEAAILEYRVAIQLESDRPEAHGNLAHALHRKGDLDDAIKEFRIAIELEPDHAQLYVSLGTALEDKGDEDNAIAAYRKAIEVEPDFADAHAALGIALVFKGDLNGAVDSLHKAIRLKPNLAQAHGALGVALRNQGELDGAIASYRKAIQYEGGEQRLGSLARTDDASAHYNLGNALLAKGDAEAAIAAFHDAIRRRPDHAEAYCNLGHALMQQRRFHEAASSFRRGHEFGSKRAGWSYPSETWIEEAERKAELEGRVVEMLAGHAQPRNADERIELAVALYDQGRHQESAEMYAEAFAADDALADDPAMSHRYDAACSAALASAAGAADAVEWRGRALEWLRAEFDARMQAAIDLASTFTHWKQDPDFAGVRDRLDELSEPERAAWRALWADVELALATALSAAK